MSTDSKKTEKIEEPWKKSVESYQNKYNMFFGYPATVIGLIYVFSFFLGNKSDVTTPEPEPQHQEQTHSNPESTSHKTVSLDSLKL